MKKILALFLSCTMLLYGCAINQTAESLPESSTIEIITETESPSDIIESSTEAMATPESNVDIHSEEYIQSLGFNSLSDPELLRYVEDTVYTDLVNLLNSDNYFVENVEAVYISKEYLEELAYNSQESLYFGYKLSELDKAFQDEKYIFRLSETGQTEVVPFEEYDDTYEKIVRNVAIGTGVILLCVTVSIVSAGVGAPAVSAIFAASAKGAAEMAISSAVMSATSAGIIEAYQTHDKEKALKAAALKGSEGFMWGAITGAITCGLGEGIALHGATLNGLTMNEAATIQKETKWSLDVIKNLHSVEEAEIYKTANLTPQIVNGKQALVRKIDWDFKWEGLTNRERVLSGKNPVDANGIKIELHHVGQSENTPLAMLSEIEHRHGENNGILHYKKGESVVDHGSEWSKEVDQFFKALLEAA